VKRSSVWLSLALFLWSTAYNMSLPFLPLAAADLGANQTQVGWVQGVAYAGAAVALLPASWLADRFGRKLAIYTTWGIGSLGTLLLLFADHWQGMLPGAFFMLAGAGAMPAVAALSTEASPSAGRRRTLSTVFAAAPAGLLVGSSLGGVIAERFSLPSLYGVAALVSLLAILSLWPVPAEAARQPSAPNPSAPSSKQGGPGLKLLLLGIPAGVGFLLLSLPSGWLTPYLRDVAGLSLGGTGITNAQLAVGQIAWSALFAVWPRESGFVQLRLGRLGSLRLGRATLFALVICLLANAVFGLAFPAGESWLLIPALFLRGALFNLQPLGMALVSEATGVGDGLAGRYSLLAIVMGVATVGATVAGGALFALAPAWPFYLTGAAATLGAAALLGIMLFGARVRAEA